MVRAWRCLKLNRGVLATRAATRFDHLRLSKEERFEQGPRAHQLPCRACASAEGEPQTLALSKVALRMFQSAMMLSELAVRPVALPQSPPGKHSRVHSHQLHVTEARKQIADPE